MSDGYAQPGVIAPKPTRDFIIPQMEIAIGLETALITGGAGSASTVWPAASTAIFVPFSVATPFLIQKVFVQNGATVAGNVDIGVYTTGGSLLAHTGATAQAGVSSTQEIALSLHLNPGQYYMALVSDSATATVIAHNAAIAALWRACGVYQMATASPLPATATFAVMAQTLMPIFGIAQRSLVA